MSLKMKKFENIVIATDLDGTYFGSNHRYIVERNVERVKYFCENGGHFTFATGRLPLFIKKPIPDPQKYINMPAVMGNGTCVYDYAKDEAVEENFIDLDAAIAAAKLAKELAPDIGARATYREGFAVSDLNNPMLRGQYENLPEFMERQILEIDKWGDLKLYKVNIMGEESSIAMLYPILKEKFSHKIGVTQSASFLIELIPYGVTKAAGLKRLVDSYFGREMTLCCVGDYDNDLEMLQLADISVCPSNANENVKAICKYCMCSNDEGVIGDLIDMLDREM